MKRDGASPTMKDVARQAGVSLGTVSKVINGLPVGDEYRQRVEAAAKKLGYQVNSYARGLKTNKTYSAALIIPTLQNPFFAHLADEIAACLSRQQYRTMLMITYFDPAAEQKSISLVKMNKIDGIIALTYNPELDVDENLPFVSIDRHVSASIPCVSSDNYAGGQLAAQKLIELGSERLLFMRIGSDVYSEVDKRGAGFENYCRMENIACESVILRDGDTLEPFYRCMDGHITDGKPDFDGIFCNTDHLACRVLTYLRKRGVRVPEDVQIIGYDGILDFGTDRLYCSTIVQPVRQMAEAAVNVLLNQDLKSMPAHLSLPVRYAPGGTTRDEGPRPANT